MASEEQARALGEEQFGEMGLDAAGGVDGVGEGGEGGGSGCYSCSGATRGSIGYARLLIFG